MSERPSNKVAGVVLCRVGEHRLAFLAEHVVTIEAYHAGGQSFPQARTAFSLPQSTDGRAVMSDEGEAVVVDALEVQQDAVALMPAPLLMGGAIGGSLAGFATIQEKLWPVLQLSAFSRFLSSRSAP